MQEPDFSLLQNLPIKKNSAYKDLSYLSVSKIQ